MWGGKGTLLKNCEKFDNKFYQEVFTTQLQMRKMYNNLLKSLETARGGKIYI